MNEEHAAAAEHFGKALALQPRAPEIARNLGATLQILGRTQEAIDCYARFLRLAPGTADIHHNLGNALADSGAHAEAVASYERALQIEPGRVDVRVHLGRTLDEVGEIDRAGTQYEAAVARDPASFDALRSLAGNYADQGRTEEAEACYTRVLSISAEPALRLQSAMLLPVIPASVADIERSRARFESEVDRLSGNPPPPAAPLLQGAATNFYLSYHGLPNRSLHAKVAGLYQRVCPSLHWRGPGTRRTGRIRVGFISRFLHDHSIGKTTRGLIAKLDRERFETVAIFVAPLREDETTRLIRARSERSVVVPVNLDAARRKIAALELDVLFYQDIGMEPFTYFLAFSRLAPVQCVSFGHPDTTGIPEIDYFVSNDRFEPEGAQAHYSERLFMLRDLGTLAYYYRAGRPATMRRREQFGFPEGTRLYLCPQVLFKLHPAFDPVLGEILRADPAGRVVLIEGRSRNWARLLRERLTRSFPDVAGRVVFLPPQSAADFSSLIAACDVMLDTPHFNGMNTSLEAFAIGTPVVTMPTALQRGRHTAGMYSKMGLGECVARSSDEYVRIALELGRDPERRRHVATQIAARSGVLFEDPRVVSEFERFFAEAVAAVR